ncbi:MAG: pre-peptidase C-terminal domain-containing protein [Planctomycetaceae bacterium]|nr:pre-peptidase C-terminal domain-containing protein [Planctomycetales bacterium]MCB9923957.1 pre-peptidase C-terminal domain-containing protein [Planctomycetaceae bacterium]
MKLNAILQSLKFRSRTRRRPENHLAMVRRRRASVESLEDRRMLAVAWDRIEPLGSLMFQADVSGEIGAPIAVFSDDFESGSLGPQWTTSSSTPYGRVGISNILGAPANSGSFHLAMDTSYSGPYNLNEAILNVDLSGVASPTLMFAHQDINDEDSALPPTFVGSYFGDGVSISDDGTTWHRLVSLNDSISPNGVYTTLNFDLATAASTAGIALGPNFQIKFQQFDNFSFNSDGRTFDDVSITGPGALSETTTAFLEADQTLTVVATPRDSSITLTATVRDPSNTVIASGTSSGPGETLDLQTIGIAVEGDYTVEISGDSASEYDLQLFRNATVEVVDTDDGAEQDATGSFIPLGSGRFGIVGSFNDSDAGDGGGDETFPVVWAIQPGTGSILKIDPSTGGVFDSFPAPDALNSAHRLNGLSIAEDGNTLLYVNSGVNGNNLYRLDPDSGSVLSVEFLSTDGSPFNRGGLSFESGATDSIFAIDDGSPVDRQAGFGGPVTDWTPSGVGFPGALGGDDNGRLFVFLGGQIREFSTTIANVELNAFSLPPGANSAYGLAFDGVNLYLSEVGGGLYTLDPDTGAVLNQVNVAGGFLSGLAADIVPFVVRPHGGYSPPAEPDIYGDPGEPGRFPNGPSSAAQPVAPNELLVNGSFETGDFTGWNTVTTAGPFRPWAVTGAGQGGGFGMLQTQPQDGAFTAWNGFDGIGPMEFQMYQDVAIAAGETATLSWMDRVQWNFTVGGTATLPRLYDVEIRDPATNAILSTVYSFSTDVQAVNPTGNTDWLSHSVNVSSFAGQTVRVLFREQIPQTGTGSGQIEFDAISLTEDAISEETLYAGVGRGSPINPGGVLLVDDTSGAGTLLADPITPGGLTGLGFDSSDRLWGSSIDGPGGNRVSNLVEIDPDTGALLTSVAITRSGIPVSIGDLAIQPGTDVIFGVHSNADASPFPAGELYTIDRATGVATVIGNTLQNRNGGIGFAPDGTLYMVDFNELHTISTTTGALLTTITTTFGGHEGLAVRPSDGKIFTAQGRSTNGNEGIWTIDPTTGISTFVGNTGTGGASDLAFRITSDSTGRDIDEYLLDLTGKAGQRIDIAFSTDVEEGNTNTLELLDVDGTTVLATGADVSDNFALGILDFVVPADGVYTVRVSSDGQGSYGIVVTDPLVFDTEANQPISSPLRSLDAYDGALGFLGEGAVAGGNVDLSLLTSFESMTLANSGFIPPDPILAAGPASVVAMVNTDMAIHDKTTGTVISQADLRSFWGTSNVIFDPWITFDPDSGRFIAMGVDRSLAGIGSSRVYLAVSTDSTPTNLTVDWNKYVIDRTGTHTSTGGTTFPDYPKLGVNDDAIFITGNDFGIQSGGFSHVSLFAIEKAPLLSGGPVNIVYDEVITGAFSIHPVTVYDPGAPMYFAQSSTGSGNSIRLHAITNILTAPTRTTSVVSVPSFAFPPDVPQQGGSPLDSVDARIMSGVVRDGRLWTAHAVLDPSVDTETVVRWYEFDVSDFPTSSATLVQSGNVDPGPGVHTWMANLSVDNDGDMGIAFSISGPNQYAGIGYTGRLASDPLGTTRPVEIARSGDGPYSLSAGGRNRWGDYSGLSVDPDGESFWLYNEYAGVGNTWRTFVGEFQVEPSGSTISDVDTYEITLAAGETIGLTTITPFDSAIDGLNLLDPSLEILDPNGVSVAFDSNSGTDGKNAALSPFTATAPGVYKVIVAGEDSGTGEYVLSLNRAPVLDNLALSADSIFENESVSLAGTYSDRDLGDSHTVVVAWDDPNNPADSTFSVPAIDTLSVGDTFNSTSDGAVFEVVSVDLLAGEVGFEVANHQYLDDGSAPGNGTAEDVSSITVSVTDDRGLTDVSPDAVAASGPARVGYYDMGVGAGVTAQVTPIVAAGQTPVQIFDLSAAELASIDVLFVQNPSNGGYGSEYVSQLATIQAAVDNGLVLLLHDRYVSNAESVLPGGTSFNIVRDSGDNANIDVLDTSSIVVDGPGGIITNTSLDGGTSSSHGFAVQGSLPGDASLILSRGNPSEIVTFSYAFGDGDVLYSSIPLDYYLAGNGPNPAADNFRNVYAPNVVAYGASLLTSPLTVTVKNVVPIVSNLAVTSSVDEGDFATLSGEIGDPGTLDAFTLEVNWGDGNVESFSYAAGTTSFNETHQYTDDNPTATPFDTYLVTVTLSDDDGGVATSSDANGLIYTTHGDGTRLGTIDPSNGAGVDVGAFGSFQTWAAAFDTDGTLYTLTGGFTGNARLATVDQTVGTVTLVGPGVGTSMLALEVADDGTMYGVGYLDRILYEIDQTTGAATAIGDTGIGAVMDLAFDSSGTLYATVDNRLWTLDTSTGSSTFTGVISGIGAGMSMGIMFDAADTLFATAYVNDSPLYTVDLGSLAATPIGTTSFFRPHGGDIWLGENELTVTVNNVDPSANAGADQTVDEGDLVTLTGSFTDQGVDDGHKEEWTVVASNGQAIAPLTIDNLAGDDNGAGGSSFSFVPGDNGVYTVTYTVTDDDGGVHSDTSVITVKNVAPVIESFSVDSLVINENGSVTVSGTISDAGTLDTHSVVIDWGGTEGTTTAVVTQDAGSATFTATHQYLDDDPTNTPSDGYTITATVTDDDGDQDDASLEITVNNVAPTITELTSGAEDCGNAHEDNPITLDLSFDDIGSLDEHTVVIDWADGTTDTVVLPVGTRSLSVDHDYAVGGIYSISVSVNDDDMGADASSVLAVVSGVGLHDGVLQIIGTAGDDHVTVNQTGNGTLKVHADFIAEYANDETRDFVLADVDRIFMLLCDGNDHATISGRVTLDAVIDGGDGDDQLNGGDGSNVILGGAGNDQINGGSGRDILIGGLGEDRIVGNPESDLISGGVLQNASTAAMNTIADMDELLDMQSQLRDADESQLDAWRADVDSFFAGLNVELVDDGGDEDQLTGSSAEDLFATFANDVVTDANSNDNGKGGINNGKGKK